MSADRESGGGGMTGATGDLTPDDPADVFEPGERRDIEGTDAPAGDEPQADATERAAARESRVGGDDLTDEPDRF